jgi:hypothetical protein
MTITPSKMTFNYSLPENCVCTSSCTVPCVCVCFFCQVQHILDDISYYETQANETFDLSGSDDDFCIQDFDDNISYWKRCLSEAIYSLNDLGLEYDVRTLQQMGYFVHREPVT